MTIDVLIPCFNSAQTLEESISSIQNQTYQDIRIIVIDDGSTDNTSDILLRLKNNDDRIIVISKDNGGIVSALNLGLKYTSAPFIARHDADDIAFPDRLFEQLDYLSAHPDCVAVAANMWIIDGEGRRTGEHTDFIGDVSPDPYAIPSTEPYLMHPSLLVRREALIEVGGYRYAFHSEDTDLYWRLLRLGRLHNLPALLGEYRRNPQSISNCSVHNGRISAIFSQLAAISFLRRENNQNDLIFSSEEITSMNKAKTFGELISLAARQLTHDEARYLEQSASAKLLELSIYRMFSLEIDDYFYISKALSTAERSLTPERRSILRRLRAQTASRLIQYGDVYLAVRFMRPPSLEFLHRLISHMRNGPRFNKRNS